MRFPGNTTALDNPLNGLITPNDGIDLLPENWNYFGGRSLDSIVPSAIVWGIINNSIREVELW